MDDDNDFNSTSQNGQFMVELFDVKIPENMKTSADDAEGVQNTVYMLKIKVRTEIKVIYVGAPN